MVSLSLPSIPPSINHFYGTGRGGKRFVTEAGQAYINEAKVHLARNFPQQLAAIKVDKPYLVYFRVYFDTLFNQGWPTKAKTRYKTNDASNRIKVLEDVLKKVAGIDDTQNLIVVIEKRMGRPLTEIFMWSLEEEATPFDGLRAL